MIYLLEGGEQHGKDLVLEMLELGSKDLRHDDAAGVERREKLFADGRVVL